MTGLREGGLAFGVWGFLGESNMFLFLFFGFAAFGMALGSLGLVWFA